MNTTTQYTLHTTTTAPTPNMGQRVITATFRQPARSVHCMIDDAPFVGDAMKAVPMQYRAIVEASLMTAAKDILSDYVKGFTVGLLPTTMDSGYFSDSALIDRATNTGIQWLSKEEITEQWKLSTTYQQWIANPKYKGMPAFAKAVNYYSDLITKLAGKTSTYKDSDLDLILAKLNEDDLTTTLGGFVVRRVEALKAKPVVEDVNAADLL
jgi:hypothetical protein